MLNEHFYTSFQPNDPKTTNMDAITSKTIFTMLKKNQNEVLGKDKTWFKSKIISMLKLN